MIFRPPFSGIIGPAGGGGGGPTPAVVGQALLYSGTGSAQSITGASFSPDLGIFRRRNTNGGALTGTSWNWIDNVRGVDKAIFSNSTGAESTDASRLTSFDANGFTLGASAATNLSGGDFLVLLLQQVANAFAIKTYSGTGAAHAENHSLGVTPELILVKNLTSGTAIWIMYPGPLSSPETKFLQMPGNNAVSTAASAWNNTAPTSTQFTVGTAASTNGSGATLVAYLFASLNPGVDIGTYTGDGLTNGPVVTTGFKPRFVVIKRTDSTGPWYVFDDQRDPTSPHNTYQSLNTAGANEDVVTTNAAGGVDFLSTGFQSIDSAAADINISGATYIYLAIA